MLEVSVSDCVLSVNGSSVIQVFIIGKCSIIYVDEQHHSTSKHQKAKEVVLLIDNICLTVCKGGKFTKIKATHLHRPLLAGCSTGHKTPPTQINCSQRWFHGFQITQDHLKDKFA